MYFVVVIPALNPKGILKEIITSLNRQVKCPIIIIDDGSCPEYATMFQSLASNPSVTLLKHEINLGKGMALKTAFNHVYQHYRDCAGIVTMDADGQHTVHDVLRTGKLLLQKKNALILGTREFEKNVPFRSRFGNRLTAAVLRLVWGIRITDTQTGLRGIPRGLIPNMLSINSSHYEYELDMLLACHNLRVPIIENKIETIYENRNATSHFSPVWDSLKIYFALFRFSLLALSTAIADYLVFTVVYYSTHSLGTSIAAARVGASIYNFCGNYRFVFRMSGGVLPAAIKYGLLVTGSGFMAYSAIHILFYSFGVNLWISKILVELFLFFANFAIQRDFIFHLRKKKAKGVMPQVAEASHYASLPQGQIS